MGSLFLLLFIGFILAILVWIVIKVPWWAKPLVVIGAFLAVTADGYLGRRKLEKMCQEQGGLHIYKTVDNVEGFELGNSSLKKYLIEKYGYVYVERKSYEKGKVDRLRTNNNSEFLLEKDVIPKSTYLVDNIPNKLIVGNYEIDKYQITNKNDGSVLAEYIVIGYFGGWVDRFLNAAYASQGAFVAYCPVTDGGNYESRLKMIINTLKPKKKEK